MKDVGKLIACGWAGKQYVKNLWITYKLTLEQFNQFWYSQDGKCAGCQGTLAHPIHKSLDMGLKPEVDHNHEPDQNGKVRGLLCHRCNDFLGKVHNNQDILKNLISYLERNGEHIL